MEGGELLIGLGLPITHKNNWTRIASAYPHSCRNGISIAANGVGFSVILFFDHGADRGFRTIP
jgi:hypothetical protein